MSENRKKELDLTEGTVGERIMHFIWPVLLASVFQQFYSLTNQLIVGNYVSKEALSAVSACSNVTNIFTFFFGGIGLGSGIVVSHAYGAKKQDKLKEAIDTSLLMSFFGGIMLTILSEATIKLIMGLININETLYPIAYDYMRVYMIGNMAVFMYNMCFYIFRSVGDSKHPLYYLILSSVFNLVLGVIFVRVFNMNVIGTALATIISQFIVDILCVRLMVVNPVLNVNLKELKMNWKLVWEICRLGIPAGIQNTLIAMAGVTVQAYTNLFSNEIIAGVGVGQRVTGYAQIPLHAFTTVTTSYVGQNYGAGKYDRVREGMKYCLRLSNIVSLTLSRLCFIFAKELVGMFNKDPEIIRYGVEMVRYTVFSTIFIGWSHIYNGVCRGAGNVRFPLIIAVVTQVIIRYVYVVVAFKIRFNVVDIYVANCIGYFFAGIVAFLYFRFSSWTLENHLRV